MKNVFASSVLVCNRIESTKWVPQSPKNPLFRLLCFWTSLQMFCFWKDDLQSGIADGSGEAYMLNECGYSHIHSDFLSLNFEKSHVLLQLKRLSTPQDGLNWVYEPSVRQKMGRKEIDVAAEHDDLEQVEPQVIILVNLLRKNLFFGKLLCLIARHFIHEFIA